MSEIANNTDTRCFGYGNPFAFTFLITLVLIHINSLPFSKDLPCLLCVDDGSIVSVYTDNLVSKYSAEYFIRKK